MRLVLAAADDAASRGLAPNALRRRIAIGAAAALAILALAAGWILTLRKAYHRSLAAEQALREINTTLETRVADHTADLESARRDLAEALRAEQELGELKSRFVSMVSHEFRTPLGVTMSALELLRHHRARLPESSHTELLDDIHSSTLRMSDMMEQILALGRVESGKTAFRPQPLDLPELCTRIASEIQSATGQAREIETHFDGELSPVMMDEGILRHVLGNLLSNAIKYSPPETPVTLQVAREDGEVRILVTDNGIGIPEPDQGKTLGQDSP